MTTSHTPSTSPDTRVPLRLALTRGDQKQVLDGAWWPQSRDLPTELAESWPAGTLVRIEPGDADTLVITRDARPS